MCLALAPLGAPGHRAAQLARVDRRRARASAAGIPSFVAPEYDLELGMANGVTPASVAARARRPLRTRGAVFLVSPTYYGMVADIAGCAEVCHAAGVPLVVDQAWGPHFGFHPDLPPSAADAGRRRGARPRRTRSSARSRRARCCTSSTASASTSARSAARCGSLRTTSPSSLLLASLDASRRQIAVHGEAILARDARGGRAHAREARRRPGPRRSIGEEHGRPPGRRRLGPDAHRDRRARDRLQRLRGRRRAAPVLRRAARAGDARDGRARRRRRRAPARRSSASRATSTRP